MSFDKESQKAHVTFPYETWSKNRGIVLEELKMGLTMLGASRQYAETFVMYSTSLEGCKFQWPQQLIVFYFSQACKLT